MEFKKPKGEQKKPVFVGLIVIIVFALAGLGYLIYWFNNSSYISSNEASIKCSSVSISSEMMGLIEKILVNEGTKVKAGDLLIQLENAGLQAQELQLVANLKSVELQQKLAGNNLELADNDFKRKKKVYDAGNLTLELYEHATKDLEAKTIQYSIASVQVDTAKAQLDIIRAQMQNTKIIAPISGIIAKKNYSTGEIVQPGQPILVINDLSNVWITANFPETKIRLIHQDQKVNISVDAYPSYDFKGRIASITSGIVPPPFSIGEATKVTQKVPVKIVFDNIPESIILQPGLSVVVSIRVK